MLATIQTDNLPSALSMWFTPLILSMAVVLIARMSRKFYGPGIERGWYSFFGFGFLALFTMTIGFIAMNEGIRHDLIEEKGWLYLFSITTPSLTFSLVMLAFSKKIKNRIYSLDTNPANAPH